mmetsp:Transcript_118006/g.328883  ORF Transcript_118006/g.328883 Transcript_118006/m.328883 type:complete len:553 (+) Transcript_118006:30-1688(+)
MRVGTQAQAPMGLQMPGTCSSAHGKGWAFAARPLLHAGEVEACPGKRERSDVADLERCLLTAASPSPTLKRSRSWCDADQRIRQNPELQRQKQLRDPGGFRRGFLHSQAEAKGIPVERRPDAWHRSLMETPGLIQSFTQTWKELCSIYDRGFDPNHMHGTEGGADLKKLSDFGAAVAIFKGMCGPSSLTLPRAWSHGGLALSTLVYPLVGVISTVCVSRLLAVRTASASFGDLMETALGRAGRWAVNVFLVLLQSGICVSYNIMLCQVLQSTLLPWMPKWQIILWEAALFAPLAAIRKVAKLWPLTLLGTALVLSGLIVSLCLVSKHALTSSSHWEELRVVRPDSFLTFLGTACFSFEGIGLVLPIYDSVRNPQRFLRIYALTMVAYCLLNGALAFVGYVAFGRDVQAMVLLNLPQGPLEVYVKVAYDVAMVCTFPLQLMPAVRLVEDCLFVPVSAPPLGRKCRKSLFRAAYVAFLALVAIIGATSLDHFISVIGAMCGIPLAFIFPSLCHGAAMPSAAWRQRCVDYALALLGFALAVLVTARNIWEWCYLE